MARDEMVDGKGGCARNGAACWACLPDLAMASWRNARRLDRVMEEEGVASLSAWLAARSLAPSIRSRCHFSNPNSAGLEAGLAQRAHLLDTVLADLYGDAAPLADGRCAGRARVCQSGVPSAVPRPGGRTSCRCYAADLVRVPDGTWHVLADRTDLADGLAHALQNRRQLGRVVPELFARNYPATSTRSSSCAWTCCGGPHRPGGRHC